jgi:hypothetical protein
MSFEYEHLKSICIVCGDKNCDHEKIEYEKLCCLKIRKKCEHDRRKEQCKECCGSQICKHKKNRSICQICKGSQICSHEKLKAYCKSCDGSRLCKSPLCEISANKKYENYCLRCYIHLFPEQTITRNYKTKERRVVDSLKSDFKNLTWIHDKKIEDGCSKYRPDLLLDMGSHIIIVEIDENKHTNYDCSCENKRLMALSQDLQHRPITLIRFNPDSYKNEKGELIKSCWKNNKLGIAQIEKSKQVEWDDRLNCLKNQIKYWIENPTEKILEIIELFY